MKRLTRILAAAAAVLLLALAALWQINFNDGVDLEQPPIPVTDAQAQLQRGAYLARVGNCLACHTARGGATGAGGRPIATDFGTVFTSNLTPVNLKISNSVRRIGYQVTMMTTQAVTLATNMVRIGAAWTPTGTNLVVVWPHCDAALWRVKGQAQ